MLKGEEINKSDVILNVDSLTKKYFGFKTKTVLNNISFSIKQGNCLGIVGRNGSGKSTLLKIIAGLMPFNSGSLYLSGNVGYVPENSINYPSLSGRDNLNFYRELGGIVKTDKEILEKLELKKDLNTAMKKYSKGMKRKIDILRAIESSPKLLIMDEPLDGCKRQSTFSKNAN